MSLDLPSAGGPAGARPRRPARAGRRAWRRRSRRGQVSAVVTILALLLLVTVIANYLTTTLPNTMSQNDLQREVTVENQVAQLSALLVATASSNAVGAQVSQPVTLGSQGAPPFAGPDGASLTPLAFVNNTTGNFPQTSINFTLLGPTVYTPPTGGPQGGVAVGCTTTSNTIVCSASATVIYNFTGSLGNQSTYTVTLSGASTTAIINISASHSTIGITGSSTTRLVLEVLGSNDTVTATVSSVPETIVVAGSYDSVALTGSASPSTRTNILVVGNQDTVTTSSLSGTNTVVASLYGSSDTVNPGTITGTSNFGVYFNGYNPASPSLSCPVDNLSSSDTVSKSSGSGSFAVTYNNTLYAHSGGTVNGWTVTYSIPTPFSCPFVTQAHVPVAPGGTAGFTVQLHNTYNTPAEVAYDQGAVVYAQPGGVPLFVVPPPVTYANNVLSLFVPRFINSVAGESGTGTADLTFRMIGSSAVVLPAGGFTFLNGSRVTIRVTTPYASAWWAYLSGSSTLSPYVTCTGPNQACTASYQSGGARPLGTITFSIPTSGLTFKFLTGWFSVTVL